MPDIGHVAVGLAAARLYEGEDWSWRAGLAFSALSLLPDADIPLALGHRGWTHSLAFAALIGLLALRRGRRDALFAFIVVASHGALDMLDQGRLGVKYLWPLSGRALFWAWRPLPGGEPAAGWLSSEGAWKVGLGAVWFLPLLAYAFRGRIKVTSP